MRGVEAGDQSRRLLIMACERDYRGLTGEEPAEMVKCMDSQCN